LSHGRKESQKVADEEDFRPIRFWPLQFSLSEAAAWLRMARDVYGVDREAGATYLPTWRDMFIDVTYVFRCVFADRHGRRAFSKQDIPEDGMRLPGQRTTFSSRKRGAAMLNKLGPWLPRIVHWRHI
jgi:hypothetical protein